MKEYTLHLNRDEAHVLSAAVIRGLKGKDPIKAQKGEAAEAVVRKILFLACELFEGAGK